MGWLTDELLFYGGIAIAAGSLVIGIICFSISLIRKVHLENQLDAEYGKIEQ